MHGRGSAPSRRLSSSSAAPRLPTASRAASARALSGALSSSALSSAWLSAVAVDATTRAIDDLRPMAAFPTRSAGAGALRPRREAASAPCERSPVFCTTFCVSLRTRSRVCSSVQKSIARLRLPTPISSAASLLSTGHISAGRASSLSSSSPPSPLSLSSLYRPSPRTSWGGGRVQERCVGKTLAHRD